MNAGRSDNEGVYEGDQQGASNEVVQLMISSLGQARIRLMAKGGTTNLIIIFPAFHSICLLSSLGAKLQNRLPMYMITCFQFTLPSIVLQRQWPISQTHTWECRAPFLLLTAAQ